MSTGRGRYVKGRAKLSVLYLIPITLPPSKVSLTAYGQHALFLTEVEPRATIRLAHSPSRMPHAPFV